MIASPRPPDLFLAIKTKNGPVKKGRIGVGWRGEKGAIRLQLNPGVTISWDDEVYLALFPYEDTTRKTPEPVFEQEPEPPAWEG